MPKSATVFFSSSISVVISSTLLTTSKKRSTESDSKIKVEPVSRLSGGRGSEDSSNLSSSISDLMLDSMALFSTSSIVWSAALADRERENVLYLASALILPLLITA